MSHLGIAAQLYTVRDLAQLDFAGTAGRVAAIGYRAVELAGFGNLASAGAIKNALDSHQLACISSHVPIEDFERDPDAVMLDNELIGNHTLVLPWLAEERRRSADDWRWLGEFLNKIGRLCTRRGFKLAYHNHAFEFDEFAGQRAFDILWSGTDPQFVKAELDVYWIAFANQDPLSWMRRLSDRLLLLHLKDLADTPDRRFAEVGAGTLDFAKILHAAQSIGVQWGIVEQDDTYGQCPIACLKTSFDNLKKLCEPSIRILQGL
jgi:sugar phosphate isomerase/epimerase